MLSYQNYTRFVLLRRLKGHLSATPGGHHTSLEFNADR